MLIIDDRYLHPDKHGLSFHFPVLRHHKADDMLVSAGEFKDKPARLTAREAEFCKLLIDMACQLSTAKLPVIFNSQVGKLIMDKGCIKFSEHRGFVRALQNDELGLVSFVELNFSV
jgi:hypothetical protein